LVRGQAKIAQYLSKRLAAVDRVNDMDVRENPPTGLIAHVLTDIPGGIRAVDIWESEADFQTFAKERLMPSAQKVSQERGISTDEISDATFVEAFDLFVRGG
jgi:hypothetical protein